VNVAAAKLLRRLVHAMTDLARRRHEREELQLLDAWALRDLGLDRSELGSCHAEATGAAHCTRRRIAGV
jgi:uncharacterized protein YjiS (DUF1127 family)